MALYFLNFDLNNLKKYETLYDELDKFGAIKISELTWCLNRFETDTFNLKEFFRMHINADDCLMVSEVTEWSAWNSKITPENLK